MFTIKICGVTSVKDALMAAAAGADAVGLNFYPRSPRRVTLESARHIAEAVAWRAVKVGVFVNAPSREVCETFDTLHLELIQLHGDEPPEFLAELGGRPVMRAFRVGPSGLDPVAEYLHQCRRLGCLPRLTLIDACQGGQYGGTGVVADWRVAEQYTALPDPPPLVLAGGLTPQNVAQAIETVRPSAVDSASGVEGSPGRKNDALVLRFVKEAKAAFARYAAGPPPA